MRRFLICFSLVLLVAAMAPASAYLLPPWNPGEYTGPSWFPGPPALVFDAAVAIERPGNSTEQEPPEGILPLSAVNEPGDGSPGRPGRKPSTGGLAAAGLSITSEAPAGAFMFGPTAGGAIDPRAELEDRVRDARRTLDD